MNAPVLAERMIHAQTNTSLGICSIGNMQRNHTKDLIASQNSSGKHVMNILLNGDVPFVAAWVKR
jgi:hypothetical protein